MHYFQFTKAALATIAISIAISTMGMQAVAARKVTCTTQKEFNRLMHGKWLHFTFKINGISKRGKIKYLKNGKTIVITQSGSVHSKGTWKRKGNTIHRYAPDRPGPIRFKSIIKKSCK